MTRHRFTTEQARAAGRAGGSALSRDRAHMAAIGQRGGVTVSRDRAHMAAIGRSGGRSVRGRLRLAEVGAETHVGLARAGNEDAVLADRQLGLCVVADGVGGRPDGEVASAIAVSAVHRAVRESRGGTETDRLRRAVRAASLEVWDRGGCRTGMVTTVACFLAGTGGVAVAWAGDSRVYLLPASSGRLHQVTSDHAEGHVLARVVGERDSDPDVRLVVAEPGDVVLACTDGLWNMACDEDVGRYLAGAREPGRAQGVAADLVKLALRGGGRDNVTVAVARLGAP